MAKRTIELNHYCHVPGAEGVPGSVIEVDEALAEKLIAAGGANAIAVTPPPPAAAVTEPTGEPAAGLTKAKVPRTR
jgi:hypothetical protein